MEQISATLKDRVSSFFYAIEESQIYDLIVDLTQKDYRVSHETLTEFVRIHLLNNILTPKILNLGSGTGLEALNILKLYPNAEFVCVDFSQQMHDIFISKMKDSPKIKYICEDILKIEDFGSLLNSKEKKFDIVITAYALHHYTLDEKRKVYNRIAKSLPNNGLFLNLDLSNHQSSTLNQISQLQIENWIVEQFEKCPIEVINKLEEQGFKSDVLVKKWIDHVKNINIPQIIDSRISKPDNETEILYMAGFKEVGIPYRYFQSAIIWAKK